MKWNKNSFLHKLFLCRHVLLLYLGYLTFRKDFAIKLSVVLTFQLCARLKGCESDWRGKKERKEKKNPVFKFWPKTIFKGRMGGRSFSVQIYFMKNSQFGLRTQTNSVFKMKLENWCLANAEVWQMYLPLNWEFVFTGKRLIFFLL